MQLFEGRVKQKFGGAFGENSATPNPNTLLGRLKTLADRFGSTGESDTVIWLLKQLLDTQKHRATTLINYETGFVSLTTVAAFSFRTVSEWLIPGNPGEIFVPHSFNFNTSGSGFHRLVSRLTLGSWSLGGGFVDGGSAANSIEFWTDVELRILQGFNDGNAVNTATYSFTINYLNQAGQAKSAVTTIQENTPANARVRMVLASGDIGVRDITGITLTSGSTSSGSFEVFGIKEFTAPFNGQAIAAGRTMAIEYAQSSTGTVTCRGSVTGNMFTEV